VRISESEDPGTVKAIAGLPDLHTFELYTFGLEEVQALATAGRFRSLGRLMLSAPLRGDGAKALAKAKMPRLAVLELTHAKMQNEDVVVLAGSPLFENLRSIRLYAAVGDKAITALAESDSAEQLQSITLQDSAIGKKGLRLLATRFPNLLALRVQARSKTEVEDATRFLAELNCPSLRSLALDFPMSDAAAIALAGNPTFANLSILGIVSELHRDQAITSKGIAAMLTSKYLTNLKSLALNGKRVDGAAEALCDPSVLPRARRIHIGVSDRLGVRIASKRPSLTVR
jgi:hypothetical protein